MAQKTKIDNVVENIEITGGQITGSTPASRASSGNNNNGFATQGLRVFKYIASDPSGSRFTEILNFDVTDFTMPTGAGDRLYFSAPQGIKAWAIFALPLQAKSTETLIGKYWSATAGDLVEVDYMAMNGQCLDQSSKQIWEITNDDHFTINRNIDADWIGRDNILDKIPNTGDSRHWVILENPVGGIATPARLKSIAYRSNGVSQLDCNKQSIFWGTSRVKISHKMPAIEFWNGGIPNVKLLDITSTAMQSVHKLRSALGDTIKGPWSFPFGVDTSTPIEILLSYSASAPINTADLEINLKSVSHTNGNIGVSQTSDRIITKNINISATGKVESIVLIDDYSIADFLEADIIFIQLKRTDNNGGEFYPIEFCINYHAYKIGKF